MKLKGHTDNIRALLLDSTGRFVQWSYIFSLQTLHTTHTRRKLGEMHKPQVAST